MIKIYRDENAKAIFLEDANGVQFLNSLHAVQEVNNISVIDLAKNISLVTDTIYSDFVDENDNTYGSDASEVTNQLNALFTATGTPTTEIPVITSPTSINSVSNEIINYELTANYGVGYEWGNLPNGLLTVDGNIRKLIGSLPTGTYTPTMKAVNYNGEDIETLTINVSNPPFANTKSVNFVNNDYLNGNASSLTSVFGRTGNGSGASEAWSVSLYFKAGTSNNNEQTIFYFGDYDYFSRGTIQLKYNGQQDRLELLYGNLFNNLVIRSQNNSINTGQWQHILITYDGGTTGVQSNQVSNYYSRFKLFIDNTEVTYNNTNSNFGYGSSIDSDNFHIGKYANGRNLRNNCRIDEFAVWGSDQSSNVSDIYNSGNPFDLTTLSVQPSNWWRMGDGDTYPNLLDQISTVNLTMVNMTAADIVNDTP